MKIDGVFEGGGVKGIGLVGAISVTEAQGYRFENVAGTSAGAIVAALVAAGYDAAELTEIMRSLDYRRFMDKSALDKIPLVGPVVSLGRDKGIFEGAYLETWIDDLLRAKGVATFADLRMPQYADDRVCRHRLQVVATDVTSGRILVLPRDLPSYGLDPDKMSVAKAVRMSMSIPFFYEPVTLKDAAGREHTIVDGGVLSNFPVWLFDVPDEPQWPTFGFRLVNPKQTMHGTDGPFSLFASLVKTMLEAHDARYIADADFVRTIPIDTLDISAVDFGLSRTQADGLFESGRAAAENFFRTWDFAAYKAGFRPHKPSSRGDRLRTPAV